MENDFINITDQLPEKGRDCIVICSDGDIKEAFRCSCTNPKCKEWRDSFTGFGLIIEVIKWKYKENNG